MEQRDTNALNLRSVGLKYGMLLALISIVYFIVLDLVNVNVTEGVGRWLSVAFNFVIVFMAQREFKESNHGYMSFSEGFRIGFWSAIIAPLVSGAFTYLYIKFINTDFIARLHDQARESIEARGKLTEDQIDQAMYINAKFLTPEYLFLLGLAGGIILLIVITTVTTIFTWKPYKKIKSFDVMD